MASQHQHRKISVRPPAEVREGAKTVLAEHGWTMQQFVTASLRALNDAPERCLTALEPFKPEVRRGRPAGRATQRSDQ
jgi:hypothetical protein